jgi:hypothetical protein
VAATLFVDESKVDGFRFVIMQIDSAHVADARRRVRALAAPNALRFHAANETSERKLRALDVVSALPARLVVIEVPRTYPWPGARELGFSCVIARAVDVGATRVVIERDDTNLARDRRTASAALRNLASDERPAYIHLRAFEEPLLWVPDLIAWCWSKDAHRRRELSRRGILVEERPVA